MKICSRQGLFELVSVNQSARSEGKIEISFHESILCFLIRIAPSRHCYMAEQTEQKFVYNFRAKPQTTEPHYISEARHVLSKLSIISFKEMLGDNVVVYFSPRHT